MVIMVFYRAQITTSVNSFVGFQWQLDVVLMH